MRYGAEDNSQSWEGHFPPVLTPADVMDILNIGKNTAYHLLSTGQLRGVRVGRCWRITGDALEEYLLLK